MHFAYPPRKSSNPAPFRPRSSKLPSVRRSRIRAVAIVALVVMSTLWIITKLFGSRSTVAWEPSGSPPVVLVTVLDGPKYGKAYVQSIRENRERYAAFHGYETLIANVGDYPLDEDSPSSWSKILAVRHAMTKFPECRYVWYLEQDGYIMDPSKTLEERIMNGATLDAVMIKNEPVVPPDSIIKTSTRLRGKDVNFVVTQDREGLSAGSWVVRNGVWARFFLETWFDPMYQTYNFQKAEGHALEHLVQWHGTILAQLALVPQKTINAYNRYDKAQELYRPGDYVVRATGCTPTGERSCENELASFKTQWEEAFAAYK